MNVLLLHYGHDLHKVLAQRLITTVVIHLCVSLTRFYTLIIPPVSDSPAVCLLRCVFIQERL